MQLGRQKRVKLREISEQAGDKDFAGALDSTAQKRKSEDRQN